ncbi:Extensin-like [Caenorhabditis elegans]|uniref:Extensin-like n=1 Tax=Caenorhabditis elegans TaxID=6239 RepID=A0A7R9SUJ1_CAEEL|nr:Extensin-like [Caenorhabditis elegans]CAD8108772.1 Extensin-like [Caenorhabditis elegans]
MNFDDSTFSIVEDLIDDRPFDPTLTDDTSPSEFFEDWFLNFPGSTGPAPQTGRDPNGPTTATAPQGSGSQEVWIQSADHVVLYDKIDVVHAAINRISLAMEVSGGFNAHTPPPSEEQPPPQLVPAAQEFPPPLRVPAPQLFGPPPPQLQQQQQQHQPVRRRYQPRIAKKLARGQSPSNISIFDH